ncbi:MAG: aminodeoxychorismate/anthranilate synthase component II [Nitrososphaerota archaeon]
MRVLILDNYDSFVYNLAQYVGALGAKPIVKRSDEITFEQARRLAPDRIIISPGPGRPGGRSFGISGRVIQELGPEVPLLGICLGHQGIAQAFGAKVGRAARVMHGKLSEILHDGRGVLTGLPNPFSATRYHSLVVERESLPKELRVTALSVEDGEVMGLRHTRYPIEGLQFHPESIMTGQGMRILRNFIRRGVRP